MMNNCRTELVARHSILTLLSDEEIASVSMAETSAALAQGDEYLDLSQLERGVRLVADASTPLRNVLPRRAVCETTWNKVLRELEAYRAATAHFGVGRGKSGEDLAG